MDSDRIQMGLKRIPRLNLNRATWDINVFGFDVYGISFFFSVSFFLYGGKN